MCDGRQDCTVYTSAFTDKCAGTLKYMEIRYMCISRSMFLHTFSFLLKYGLTKACKFFCHKICWVSVNLCFQHAYNRHITIINSHLNSPCFAWHAYGKLGLFKTELVIVIYLLVYGLQVWCICLPFGLLFQILGGGINDFAGPLPYVIFLPAQPFTFLTLRPPTRMFLQDPRLFPQAGG